MSKGYVYIMTTAVDGIIKIGRTDSWTRRCQDQLEINGYKNMNGLKTYFVVQVDNMEEIESIMHDIFRESRVSNFEMFAVDKDRAKRVLSKMGTQVYPAQKVINNNMKSTNNKNEDHFRNSTKLIFRNLQIPIGEKINVRKNGYDLECKVVDNFDKVEYNGKIMSITDVEKIINPDAKNGIYVSYYKGIRLPELPKMHEYQYNTDFWNAFNKELDKYNIPADNNKKINVKRWYSNDRFKLKTGFRIAVDFFLDKNKICIDIFTHNNKIFEKQKIYLAHKNDIEKQLGYSLNWNDIFPRDDISKNRISYYIDNDFAIIDQKVIAEVAKKIVEIYNVFNQYE